jgi:hypothetical protein
MKRIKQENIFENVGEEVVVKMKDGNIIEGQLIHAVVDGRRFIVEGFPIKYKDVQVVRYQ